MASAVALAFDREAPSYDDGFGRNPVGLVFRHVVQEWLLRLFPPGARVLDLGCGTGSDALFLAAAGRSVHALDLSPAMIERARTRARAFSEERLRFEVRNLEDVAGAGLGFDGAYSNFGALNCADLVRVGEGLTRALRPNAPVLLSLMGRWPLPATLQRALTGRGAPRQGSTPRVAGVALPVRYPRISEIQASLGPAFAWTGRAALGVLVPGPEHAAWAASHPQSFGLLAALEGCVRRWPLLRGLGDHVVLEGVRR